MKTTMSFTEYDILAERVSKNNFKCGDWWPTVDEIKTKIEPEFNKYIEFLIWILETADQPETPEQKASKKYINQLLISKLKMTENVPASIQEALDGIVKTSNDDGDEIYQGDDEE